MWGPGVDAAGTLTAIVTAPLALAGADPKGTASGWKLATTIWRGCHPVDVTMTVAPGGAELRSSAIEADASDAEVVVDGEVVVVVLCGPPSKWRDILRLWAGRASGRTGAGVRSDARQNRVRILDCAAALILEVGGEPTRDALAQRSGVGIGTVYRHFPDRQSLLHAVARHVLAKTIGAGEQIVASDASSEEAVRRYLHEAIEHGIGVVNIVRPLLDDPDWPDLQARADVVLTALIERGRADHMLRSDLSVGDIVFAAIRFGRPLAIGLPPSEDREIAHRQLDRFVNGLCSTTPEHNDWTKR